MTRTYFLDSPPWTADNTNDRVRGVGEALVSVAVYPGLSDGGVSTAQSRHLHSALQHHGDLRLHS